MSGSLKVKTCWPRPRTFSSAVHAYPRNEAIMTGIAGNMDLSRISGSETPPFAFLSLASIKSEYRPPRMEPMMLPPPNETSTSPTLSES